MSKYRVIQIGVLFYPQKHTLFGWRPFKECRNYFSGDYDVVERGSLKEAVDHVHSETAPPPTPKVVWEAA
jgi:hypothetical protein